MIAARRAWIVLLVCLLLEACQTIPFQTSPLLEHEGELAVYLQPLKPEEQRVRFTLASVSAVREDGTEVPLRLFKAGKNVDKSGQHLAAWGNLPAAKYTGLLVAVREASLLTEQGSASLLVPDTPQKREFPFVVEKKKGIVLTMTLQYQESVRNGYSFQPAFFLTVPPAPLAGVAGYASSPASDTITVFDKALMQARGLIVTGRRPAGLTIDQVRRRAYVALAGDDAVEVIDVVAQAVLTKVPLVPGDVPEDVALTPDGQTLIAVNSGSDTVSFIDTNSLIEKGRVSVGRNPRSVLIDGTGRKAYVFNALSDTISVVDVAYRKVIGSIVTGAEPVRGAFNRNGGLLYVIHARYPYLFAADPETFLIRRKEFVGTNMLSLKVDQRTDLFYLGRVNDPLVGLYEPFSFRPVDYIEARGDAEYMTIDGEENNLYIAVPDRQALLIVNLMSRKTVAQIDVIGGASRVAMMGER